MAFLPFQLALILAHPHDDSLRLRLAAELEQAGDPRGEFIRLQVARAAQDRASGRVRRSHESAREVSLLDRHGEAWAAEVGPWVAVPPDLPGIAFHRGFVARVDVTSLAEVHTSFASAPIEYLVCERRGLDVTSLLASPLLARLRSLVISTGGGDALARAVAGCRHLGGLRHLGLPHNGIGAQGVEALVAAPWLASVPSVDLQGNDPNPRERPTFDEVGSVAVIDLDPLGPALEARYGTRAWLHFPYDRASAEPDPWMV